MSESPYQSPAPVSNPQPAPAAQRYPRVSPLLGIARGQDLLALALLLNIVVNIAGFPVGVYNHPEVAAVYLLLAFMSLLFTVGAIFNLAIRLKRPLAGVVITLLACSPCLGLIGLWWLNKQATAFLRMNGVVVGFAGARRAAVLAPQFPPRGAPGVVAANCPHCDLETVAAHHCVGIAGPCRQCGKKWVFQPLQFDKGRSAQHEERLKTYDETLAKWEYLWQSQRNLFTGDEQRAFEAAEQNASGAQLQRDRDASDALKAQAVRRIESEHAGESEFNRCPACERIMHGAATSNCRWCGYSE